MDFYITDELMIRYSVTDVGEKMGVKWDIT
jgi:hypothetical protein